MADKSTRVRILETGAKLTSGDRDKSYGDPIKNLTLAGELKRLVRAHAARDLPAGEQEALDQVLTKIARCYTGSYHPDNYIDGAAYFAIAGEIAETYQLAGEQAQYFRDGPAVTADMVQVG